MAENPLLKLLIRSLNLDEGAKKRSQERSRKAIGNLREKTPGLYGDRIRAQRKALEELGIKQY